MARICDGDSKGKLMEYLRLVLLAALWMTFACDDECEGLPQDTCDSRSSCRSILPTVVSTSVQGETCYMRIASGEPQRRYFGCVPLDPAPTPDAKYAYDASTDECLYFGVTSRDAPPEFPVCGDVLPLCSEL